MGYAGAGGGAGVSTALEYTGAPEAIYAFAGTPEDNCADGTAGDSAGAFLPNYKSVHTGP